jgi:lysozyme family protein
MCADFTKVENNLLEDEGGIAQVTGDAGGLTKYGISQRSYPLLDIRNLTVQKAESIYKSDWWDANSLDEINSQDIANKIFLGMINLGVTVTIKASQRALCAVGSTVAVDGDFGPETRAAVNDASQGWLLDRLRVELALVYTNIVENKSMDLKFLEGWLFRALQ